MDSFRWRDFLSFCFLKLKNRFFNSVDSIGREAHNHFLKVMYLNKIVMYNVKMRLARIDSSYDGWAPTPLIEDYSQIIAFSTIFI
jgi:hypothetical protein